MENTFKFILVTVYLILMQVAPGLKVMTSQNAEGSSPREIGLRLAERYLATPHSMYGNITSPDRR